MFLKIQYDYKHLEPQLNDHSKTEGRHCIFLNIYVFIAENKRKDFYSPLLSVSCLWIRKMLKRSYSNRTIQTFLK